MVYKKKDPRFLQHIELAPLGHPQIRELPDNPLSRSLARWPDRPAMALLRGLEARCYPPLPAGKATLDIGCGNGKFGEILGLKGAVGVDLDIADLARARTSPAYSAIVISDARRLPFPNSSFVCVVSNSTFEHLEDDVAALAEAARVLVPGGFLCLAVPTPAKEETLYFGHETDYIDLRTAHAYRRWFTEHWDHRRYRTVPAWSELLSKVGLTLVEGKLYENLATGFLGDLLGYVEVRFREIPVIGSDDAPRRLFLNIMYSILEPYWHLDSLENEESPTRAGGVFLRALRTT